MKTVSEKTLANGRRRVTVEVDANEKLISIYEGAHYRLGYPLEDIVPGHVIEDAVPVMWCCVGQEWVA